MNITTGKKTIWAVAYAATMAMMLAMLPAQRAEARSKTPWDCYSDPDMTFASCCRADCDHLGHDCDVSFPNESHNGGYCDNKWNSCYTQCEQGIRPGTLLPWVPAIQPPPIT
jgi:hypothetical protein